MPAFSDYCDRVPSCSAYTPGGQRATRAVSARHSIHGSHSGRLRFSSWDLGPVAEYRKRIVSNQDVLCDDGPHFHFVERNTKELTQPTVQDELSPLHKYANEDDVRSYAQAESMQHRLAALREKNRILSRDLTNQARELSAVRKQYIRQTAHITKLSEQYDAIRASSESAQVELATTRKQLSVAKAEAGLVASNRIDLMKENSHLRQEYTQAMAQIASLQQELAGLRTVQRDFEHVAAFLERERQKHAADRDQIMRLEGELKAFADIERQLLITRREADVVKTQNVQLLKQQEEAQEALKTLQDLSEKLHWLEEERRRLLRVEADCDRMREMLMHEESRTKDISEKHTEATILLKSTLEVEKTLRQEVEKQANEILMLAADLSSARQREVQKTEQLRVAIDETRRLEASLQSCSEEVEAMRSENIKLNKKLENVAKQHLEEIMVSVTENQQLRLELDSSKSHSERLSTELQLVKEVEQRKTEALRQSREEISALSSHIYDLRRQADTEQEAQQLQAGELGATIAALEQQCKSQETALRRMQSINEELEASLEAIRHDHHQRESNEGKLMERFRAELKEAQKQQETTVMKKKQLRDQLRDATKALHVTRTRNEELAARLEEAQKQQATTAAARASREQEWAKKCACLEERLVELQRHRELDSAKRQEEKEELRRRQQEFDRCLELLESLQLNQRELEACLKQKDSEIAAYKSQAERESAERAETEAAWARTLEEQVQQRVSVLEKDFALRIAKIRKKVAERAEYNHLLDELLAAERSIMRRWREGMDLWRKAVATSLTSHRNGSRAFEQCTY